MSPAFRRIAAFALLVAAAVHLPRLSAPLIWDDRPFLVDVRAYDRPIPLSSYVTPAYFGVSGELTWRPLGTFFDAHLVRAFGLNPILLRAATLTLHVGVCALLAALIVSLGLGADVGAAAAALFLIAPANLEALACVTFDRELLVAAALLLFLLAHRRGRPILAGAALAAALLSKEAGFVGLALAPLLDFLVDNLDGLRERIRAHAVYAAVAAAYLALRFGILRGPGGEANLSALLPWTERLEYAARAFVTGLRVILIPWRLRHEYFAVPSSRPALWIAAALAVLGLIVALAALARRRTPPLAFFFLWPLPFLFLTSNLVPTAVLSTRLTAERWLYLPALGACAALAYALRLRPRALAALIVAWGAFGVARARDWRDETRLWRGLVDVYPWSAKAHEGLGEALYRAGRVGEAEDEFARGLALRERHEDLVLAHYAPIAPPGTIGWDSAPLMRWLGLCRLKRGDVRGAENYFARATALQPGDVFSYRVLAYLSAGDGRFDEARGWLDKGFARDANDEFLLRLASDVKRRRLTFRARFD